jgi:hypothetical protein
MRLLGKFLKILFLKLNKHSKKLIIIIFLLLIFGLQYRFCKENSKPVSIGRSFDLSEPGLIYNTKIPKFIHQTWKNSDMHDVSIPPHVIESVKAWNEIAKNSGCRYFLWNDRDMEDLVMNYYPHILDEYLKLSYVMRSDLFRLLVLHKYGGIVSLCVNRSIRTWTLFQL